MGDGKGRELHPLPMTTMEQVLTGAEAASAAWGRWWKAGRGCRREKGRDLHGPEERGRVKITFLEKDNEFMIIEVNFEKAKNS